MSIDLLLGLQWGDEGKGKIVDVLTKNYDIIARFQGGPNAGHTLKFDGFSHVLHTIPSGIFHPTALNLIGNGVVIDPVIFQTEIEKLVPFKIDFPKKAFYLKEGTFDSSDAPVIRRSIRSFQRESQNWINPQGNRSNLHG